MTEEVKMKLAEVQNGNFIGDYRHDIDIRKDTVVHLRAPGGGEEYWLYVHPDPTRGEPPSPSNPKWRKLEL